MPIPSDYRSIVDSLVASTDEGRVLWRSGKFSIEVSIDGSMFALWAGTDEETGHEFVSFALQDGDGKVIDSWYVDENEEDYDYMRCLFNSAKRFALGVPQRLAKLQEILTKSQTIGDPESRK